MRPMRLVERTAPALPKRGSLTPIFLAPILNNYGFVIFLPPAEASSSSLLQETARVYADRITCGYRDHCRAYRPAPAGRAEGARSRQSNEVQQQPQAVWPRYP